MGFLVAAGFELIIVLALGLLLGIVGLLFGHIIVFESLALGITAAALAHNLLSIHLFFSILIGIVLAFLVFFILSTKVGFWIIAALLSFVWCFFVGMIAWSVTGGDMVWGYGMMAVGFVAFLALHYLSYRKLQ